MQCEGNVDGRELFLEHYKLAKREHRNFLLENEAAEVCRMYSIPLPDGGLAVDKASAVLIADGVGYPVVMKVVSPEIIHKSDVGGVRVGIHSKEQLVEAYDSIIDSVKKHQSTAEVRGFVVAKMAGKGVETIVGLKRDAVFGSAVMFGIGGIFVEVYKDVSFRVCPVRNGDIEEMLGEIRGRVLLEGFRGMPKVNMDALKKVIMAVCSLGMENPEVSSVDLNPVLATGEGALALDARIILQ
ncbi:MAG: acetate--CoA ligase family protein [Acidobacteria bacterium]|nr:acetate--CoA ligase family protein [Acidobacteriota bacterium]